MGLNVEKLKPAIGAKVLLDRSQIADPGVSRELIGLLEEHTVLVFPRIGLTDDEQLALTDSLGERVNISAKAASRDSAAVYQVTLNKGASIEPEYVWGTFFWHMDGLTVDVPPPKATVLSARRLSSKGGQTEFASTRAAYEALPPEEKAELKDVRVLHTVTASVREVCAPEALDDARRALRHEHPLVWTRANGRRSLIIGYTGDEVIGMTHAEGRAMLTRLLEWTAQPAFSYSHYWEDGDCVVWDNTCAFHRVVPYGADFRSEDAPYDDRWSRSGNVTSQSRTSTDVTMHRTAVAGVEGVQ